MEFGGHEAVYSWASLSLGFPHQILPNSAARFFSIPVLALHPQVSYGFHVPKRRDCATLLLRRRQVWDGGPSREVNHVLWRKGRLGECVFSGVGNPPDDRQRVFSRRGEEVSVRRAVGRRPVHTDRDSSPACDGTVRRRR